MYHLRQNRGICSPEAIEEIYRKDKIARSKPKKPVNNSKEKAGLIDEINLEIGMSISKLEKMSIEELRSLMDDII